MAWELTAEPTGVLEQEQEIVSDPKLLLVALRAAGNWTLGQIVDMYEIPRVYQGTGTCNLSTGAQYQVHIGG